VQRRADDQAGLQYTLHSLGEVHHDIGQHEQAARQHRQQAVAILETLATSMTP
jgi:hypothetical protein